MIEKTAPALLVKTISDSFCCVDWRATSDGHDNIGACSSERLDAAVDALDRSMLPYLGEGRSKGTVIFQYSFNVGNHVCLANRAYVSAEDEVSVNS